MRSLCALLLTCAVFAGDEAVKPPQAPTEEPTPAPVKRDTKAVTTIDQLKQYVKEIEATYADSSYKFDTETHTERWWIGPDNDARFALPNGNAHVVQRRNRVFSVELKLPTKGKTITKEVSRDFEKILKATFDGWFPAEELRAMTAAVRAAFNDSVNEPAHKNFTSSGWLAGENYKFKATLGKARNFSCEIETQWIDPDSSEAIEARKKAGIK